MLVNNEKHLDEIINFAVVNPSKSEYRITFSIATHTE